ncbi:hypothetical protein EYZ11_007410 [Aspergillus tanneri]|uniref:Carrier domain-containing protein n=1 Tax=Aspergillus tanneri TaxID=1220188 RepID=A0A4S3JFC1_9EURO|nr:hypothetical protein EYZ11_007410 [Aspergillus tanneri]
MVVSEPVVHAAAESFGFGSVRAQCELCSSVCLVQTTDVRFVPYLGASQKDNIVDRQPMLRYECACLLRSARKKLTPSLEGPFGNQIFLVELLIHKNPRLQILDLRVMDVDQTKTLLKTLQINTSYPRCQSYEQGYISAAGEVYSRPLEGANECTESVKWTVQRMRKYDLVILSSSGTCTEDFTKHISHSTALLKLSGIVLATASSSAEFTLPREFAITKIGSGARCTVIGKHLPILDISRKRGEIILVGCDDEDQFTSDLQQTLSEHFRTSIPRISPDDLTMDSIKPGSTVITTLELHRAVLSILCEESMSRVKVMTNNARNLIWITGGPQLTGSRPELSLVQGLSRALSLEHPGLRFFVFSTEYPRIQPRVSIRNIVTVVEDALGAKNPDTELLERDGVVYINRLVPDNSMNTIFQKIQCKEPYIDTLSTVGPAKLTIKVPGQFDTLCLEPVAAFQAELPANYVEINVKSVGLNAKTIYGFAGKVEVKDPTSASECAGVISKVGSGVSALAPGDRVLAMAHCQVSTVERVPEWSCVKLLDREDYHAVSTMPTVFGTAIYGLLDKANLQEGETVLIHSAAGGVGIAAIQIARLRGAEIFATVGTPNKKSFLVKEFGLKPQNIFSSRDLSFVPGILEATGNRGVDVVLNSLTGDLLHESWRLCAKFGRFVEIGKHDLSDAGKLDMQVFLRCATFTAFDLTELFGPENPESRLTEPRPIEPLEVFDISEAAQAFRHFSLNSRIGKVALSLEESNSLVRILPLPYACSLNPHKSYLMVGCLGGLGRSLSTWMFHRGCRKFIFLGRSGLEKKAAADLVQDLKSKGASVEVIQGDVSKYEDVERCIQAAEAPLGGIILAAMGLDASLWTTMSSDSWHSAVRPKVMGAWNLHNAVKNKETELEFFLMTSSISGILGAATESNYCAANCFLDSFARYRRSLGLPATSIALGMVSEIGYLHENPDVERLLLHKGIQPISEVELLQIVDIALSHVGSAFDCCDPYMSSHIITGLEPFTFRKLRANGFTVNSLTAQDPRASLIEAAFDWKEGPSNKVAGLRSGSVASLWNNCGKKPINEAIVDLIKSRLSGLLLQPVEQIDESLPLARFGLDSMLGSELRTWVYETFEVDISYFSLLSNTMTLNKLGKKLQEESPAARE